MAKQKLADNVVRFERSANEYYDLGRRRYASGNLSEALRYFQLAESKGMKTLALRVDIARIYAVTKRIFECNCYLINAYPDPDDRPGEVNLIMSSNYASVFEALQARVCLRRYFSISLDDGDVQLPTEDMLDMLFDADLDYDFNTCCKDTDIQLQDEGIYIQNALSMFSELLTQGNYEQAGDVVRRCMEMFPNTEFVFPYLIIMYMFNRSTTEAARELELHTPKAQGQDLAMFLLVMMLKYSVDSKTNLNPEIAILEHVKTDNEEALVLVTSALIWTQNYTAAKPFATKLLNISPYGKIANHLAGVVNYALDNYSAAKRSYALLLRFEPDDIVIRYFMQQCQQAPKLPENERPKPGFLLELGHHGIMYNLITVEDFMAAPVDESKIVWETDSILPKTVRLMLSYVKSSAQNQWLRFILSLNSSITPTFLRECLLDPKLSYAFKSRVFTILKRIAPQKNYAVAFGSIIVEGSTDVECFKMFDKSYQRSIYLCQSTLRKYNKSLCTITAYELWQLYTDDCECAVLEEAHIVPLAASVAYRACLRSGVTISLETIMCYFHTDLESMTLMMKHLLMLESYLDIEE